MIDKTIQRWLTAKQSGPARMDRKSTDGYQVVKALVLGCTAALLLSCTTESPRVTASGLAEPVIFVHGNGDDAALFISTAWRFESNGWPADRLFAFDLPHPLSRDVNDVAQPERSSAEDYALFLEQRIAEVKRVTGSKKVILIGNSRGGYPIRYFIAHHPGEVSHVVLGGTPNHGVFRSQSFRLNSEYNGDGPWLSSLNAAQGPDQSEVPPGVAVLTLRSDHNDKYAQPTGAALGLPDMKTKVDADGPALRGAENVVLPGVDHRETLYSSDAFRAMFKFLTGSLPAADIVAQAKPLISGHIYAMVSKQPTNMGLANTGVTIFEVNPTSGEREKGPLLQTTTAEDGAFGPVQVDPQKRYEFVLTHAGYSTTHLYFGSFMRSTRWLDLTLAPEEPNPAPGASISLIRISGYFNTQRDHIDIDGQLPASVSAPVPSVNVANLVLPASQPDEPVTTHYNQETIVVRAWPGRDDQGTSQRVIAELLD